MPIKTFRGKLADGGQDRIRLSTIRGQIGYHIIKFQLLPIDPMSNNQESVVKIFTREQPDLGGGVFATGDIDFSDSDLLAAAYMENDNSGSTPTYSEAAVIFDRVAINQDIYITHLEQGADACNYYIELEAMKLSLDESAVATLKDMRGTN
tara:strand:+ start:231 stop:683 length:453 start_codon:yes stop_codon:yes gene_type:complete